MKNLITLLLLASGVACAADISGRWKGTAEGPQGKIERAFNFKQEGTKLSGDTHSDFTGESKITDGKVEGDTVVFTINAKIQDNDVKLTYKGKIAGEEITFDVEIGGGGDGPQIKYVAKRVK